jgi:uncharacterized protein
LKPSDTFSYALLAQLEHVKDNPLPPVHLWHPENSRDIEMLIKEDGSWHYMNSPIDRASMVRLFAGVLRRDDEDYFLVTPAEKCRIVVEDVPFQGVLLENSGSGRQQSLSIITNVGDRVKVNESNPVEFSSSRSSDKLCLPYVSVRQGLKARLNRNVYYQLMDLVVEEAQDGSLWYGVWSEGYFSRLMET